MQDTPQTTYRIQYPTVTVQTTDADTAEAESRAGAVVTASTTGAQL